MHIHERHPYTGELVFTAFSGSHQDAINKGLEYRKKTGDKLWRVPYLPIDPADVGREYEPIIRINSQSGKGGAAFIMQHEFGYNLPKEMHPEFGMAVKNRCDKLGRELSTDELFEVFEDEYIHVPQKYSLISHSFVETSSEGQSEVRFNGIIAVDGVNKTVQGTGNGPIDAFFSAVRTLGLTEYRFVSYHEHAISTGSDSKAIAYINLCKPDGTHVFGVGIESNINLASINGVLCAINRSVRD